MAEPPSPIIDNPPHGRPERAADAFLERGEAVAHRGVELDGDEGADGSHGAACFARSLTASALTSRIASTIRSRPTAALAGLVEGST